MSEFLADENFPLPSIYLLRNAGYEVNAVIEDSPGVEDTEVMARAASEQFVVLTFDRDYGELIFHRRLPAPLGVIHLRFVSATPEEAGHRLLDLFGAGELPLESFYTVVDQNQIRQRRLP